LATTPTPTPTPSPAVPIESFVRMGDICRLLKVSRVTLWEWRRAGKFPQPVAFGTLLRWRESDVRAFIESAARVPPTPRPPGRSRKVKAA
jgi:predicted DNA-binding transcriptional regulator AlpA